MKSQGNRKFYHLPDTPPTSSELNEQEQEVQVFGNNIHGRTTKKSKFRSKSAHFRGNTRDLMQMIDQNIYFTTVEGPFGGRKCVYMDHTASGQPLRCIEEFLSENVLPYYANTHTTSTTTSSQTTMYRHEAKDIVRNSVGASEHDVVIFCGNGATGAIDKLVHTLTHNVESKPIVFVGPFEHHSNLLPWRDAGAKIVYIPETTSGLFDIEFLERSLKAAVEDESNKGRRLIGCFSVASNITGVVTDDVAITILMHKYGGLALWDYSAAAPHVQIVMNSVIPSSEEDTNLAKKDALYFSGHKLVGGPQTPGVLVAKNSIFENKTPRVSGGGAVFFVSKSHHRYLKNVEYREEAGTPAIIESIRLGLVFRLKDTVGSQNIISQEALVCMKALDEWQNTPEIKILGPTKQPRLPIISFLIEHPETGYYLHHNFVVALLNDLFGIQSRGGCACAGPYGQSLLGINLDLAHEYEDLLLEDSRLDRTHLRRYQEGSPYEVFRPGFVRIAFPYYASMPETEFVIEAVQLIAKEGWKLLPSYQLNPETGEFHHHQTNMFHRDRRWLSWANFDGEGIRCERGRSSGEERVRNNSEDCVNYKESLEQAKSILKNAHNTSRRRPLPDQNLLFDTKHNARLKWFLLPSEAQTLLNGSSTTTIKSPRPFVVREHNSMEKVLNDEEYELQVSRKETMSSPLNLLSIPKQLYKSCWSLEQNIKVSVNKNVDTENSENSTGSELNPSSNENDSDTELVVGATVVGPSICFVLDNNSENNSSSNSTLTTTPAAACASDTNTSSHHGSFSVSRLYSTTEDEPFLDPRSLHTIGGENSPVKDVRRRISHCDTRNISISSDNTTDDAFSITPIISLSSPISDIFNNIPDLPERSSSPKPSATSHKIEKEPSNETTSPTQQDNGIFSTSNGGVGDPTTTVTTTVSSAQQMNYENANGIIMTSSPCAPQNNQIQNQTQFDGTTPNIYFYNSNNNQNFISSTQVPTTPTMSNPYNGGMCTQQQQQPPPQQQQQQCFQSAVNNGSGDFQVQNVYQQQVDPCNMSSSPLPPPVMDSSYNNTNTVYYNNVNGGNCQPASVTCMIPENNYYDCNQINYQNSQQGFPQTTTTTNTNIVYNNNQQQQQQPPQTNIIYPSSPVNQMYTTPSNSMDGSLDYTVNWSQQQQQQQQQMQQNQMIMNQSPMVPSPQLQQPQQQQMNVLSPSPFQCGMEGYNNGSYYSAPMSPQLPYVGSPNPTPNNNQQMYPVTPNNSSTHLNTMQQIQQQQEQEAAEIQNAVQRVTNELAIELKSEIRGVISQVEHIEENIRERANSFNAKDKTIQSLRLRSRTLSGQVMRKNLSFDDNSSSKSIDEFSLSQRTSNSSTSTSSKCPSQQSSRANSIDNDNSNVTQVDGKIKSKEKEIGHVTTNEDETSRNGNGAATTSDEEKNSPESSSDETDLPIKAAPGTDEEKKKSSSTLDQKEEEKEAQVKSIDADGNSDAPDITSSNQQKSSKKTLPRLNSVDIDDKEENCTTTTDTADGKEIVTKKVAKWHLPPKNILKPLLKAVYDFAMIKDGDRVLVCLSGGKDSLSLLHTMKQAQYILANKGISFSLGAVTVDPGTSSYNPRPLIPYLEALGVPYFYEEQAIMNTALEKGQDGVVSICSFCSRMKRGRIYACARRNNYNVVAMGQHLDDLAESFFMSVFHNGVLRTQKASYTVKEGDLRVIRPFVNIREKALRDFAESRNLPIIAENCPACFDAPTERHRMKQLLAQQEILFPKLYVSLRAALQPLMGISVTGQENKKSIGNNLSTFTTRSKSGDDDDDDMMDEDCKT